MLPCRPQRPLACAVLGLAIRCWDSELNRRKVCAPPQFWRPVCVSMRALQVRLLGCPLDEVCGVAAMLLSALSGAGGWPACGAMARCSGLVEALAAALKSRGMQVRRLSATPAAQHTLHGTCFRPLCMRVLAQRIACTSIAAAPMRVHAHGGPCVTKSGIPLRRLADQGLLRCGSRQHSQRAAAAAARR